MIRTAAPPLEKWLGRIGRIIDRKLDSYLPPENELPRSLHVAMRYTALSKGKRVRPALLLAVNETLKGDPENAIPAACAVELIHSYSLIHDDLPAMDNDDLRRGKPSNHRAFGESTAILAGDALQAAAFEIIARHTPDPVLANRLVLELASAAGSRHLVGGQQLDLEKDADVDEIHLRKTAALFVACGRMGAWSAAAEEAIVDQFGRFGRFLGLTFQVMDDILDVTGKDAGQKKPTYPAVYGLEASRRRLTDLIESAKEGLSPFGRRAERLKQLCDYFLSRKY